MISRALCFDAFRRSPFPGKLTKPQVEGCDAIFDEWERRQLKDVRYLAYMLATAFHETGGTMQPVIETRQPNEATNPSVDVAIARLESSWVRGRMPWVKRAYWRKDPRGMSWLGRGLPQVTHEANYRWAQQATGIPFLENPDLMLKMENAVPVMFIGMLEGRFTGRKLAHYFTSTRDDPKNARQIINGNESDVKVASYHRKFLAPLIQRAA